MTTAEFMERNQNSVPEKEKYCSSVFQDTRGDFYSYGYHYPLLFKVAGLWFVNIHGYSNSTAKHINWASGHADYCVDLPNVGSGYGYEASISEDYGRTKYDIVLDALVGDCNRLALEMGKKKRKNTRVYEDLQYRHDQFKAGIDALSEAKRHE